MKRLNNLLAFSVILVLSLSPLSIEAGATLQIKGKVHAFNTKKIQIKTKRHIYHINKLALPLHLIQELEKTTNQEVTLLVPMHGIIKVKNNKKVSYNKR